jgi:hypothetical protein
LSTTGSISFGIALVAGKNRVPNPPTGKIALRSGLRMNHLIQSLSIENTNKWRRFLAPASEYA